MYNYIFLRFITILVVSVTVMTSCGIETQQEEHVRMENGTEWGVEIEVLLKNGGTAKLVCPKFTSEPVGSHGRECYLREYNKG